MTPSHAASPPSDRLITSTGSASTGTPVTVPPADQTTASEMSFRVPPLHLPRTRTGISSAFGATPATPVMLSVTAAMVPATWVPCQLESTCAVLPHVPAGVQLPSSCGLESRGLLSRAEAESVMKSYPPTYLDDRSAWTV